MPKDAQEKTLRKRNGFSLVELMAVLGIAGAGTLGFVHLQKSQMTGQKKVEAKYEATSIANSVGTLLLSKEACEQTFVGTNFSNAQNPQPFDIVRKKSGENILTAYQAPFKIGNIDVTRFEYQLNGPLVGATDHNRYGNFSVTIVYRSNSHLVSNPREERIEVPYTIKLETDPNNNFFSCYSEVRNVSNEVSARACASVGGAFDPDIPRCSLINYPGLVERSSGVNLVKASAGETNRLISYKSFHDEIYPRMFRDNFVYKMEEGDTVTGDIQVLDAFNILTPASNNSPNAAINRRYFDELFTQCGPGSIGIFTDDRVRCENLLCENTANGTPQYLVGFNPNGTKICHPLVNENGFCPSGGSLKLGSNGAIEYECCVPQCSDAANYCSNQVFEASNGCGNCIGTRPAQNATWGAWVNTGNSRVVGGATCSATCGGGSVPTEVEQVRVCNNNDECGGSTCVGNSQQWVPGPGQACNTHECPAPGKCKGGGYDTSLFVKYQPDTEVRNGCNTQYRDQWFEIDTSKFRRGNIYTITQGQTFSAEVGPSDTPTTVLNRLINLINSANNRHYRSLCNGSGSSVVTTASLVSSNRMKYHINWQHSTGPSASRSCNELDEAACGAATGCSWDTTSEFMCTGWNYTVPQGQCNGTYNRPTCMWNGGGYMGPTTYGGGGSSTNGYYQEPCIMDPYGNCHNFGGGGSDPGCEYKYRDEQSCRSHAAVNDGCSWGYKQESCYGTNQTECTSRGGGCSWSAQPNRHMSCTGAYGESQCTGAGAGVCTWGPR